VQLLHLSIPRWSRPLVEVHTLVKLLHQSIHWWSRPLVVHACVALIPADTYLYLSHFRFLLVCLFSWGLDLTCSELLCNVWRDIYYLGLYEFATIITWWELHVKIRVFLLPLHLSGRDNRGRD
jgi:hypothetical protein